MAAKLFLTPRAIEAFVGRGRKSLGMDAVGYLPYKEKKKRRAEQAVSIPVRNEYQRSEHHRKVPVIYAAGGAASVLHKPGLEGAEE